MSRGRAAVIAVLVAALASAGCRRRSTPSPPLDSAAEGGRSTAPPAVGQEEPFPRLQPDAVRQLNLGYRALRAKRFDEARAAFAAVVEAAPDYSAARFQSLRSAALAGRPARELQAEWSELLGRDYFAGAGKLDRAKELAPLRSSDGWAELKATEQRAAAAWAAGLTQGIVFVARQREVSTPRLAADGSARLALAQEAYHFDPAAGRYRRLTDTDGRLFALARSADGRQLSFLLVEGVRHEERRQLLGPLRVGWVDLATLETVGPLALPGSGEQVELGWSDGGEAVWLVDGAAWVSDSAHSALVSQPVKIDPRRGGTIATASRVVPRRSPGVTLAADGLSFEVPVGDGGAKVVRAARPLAADSLVFSPAGRRIAFAGVVDFCGAEGSKAKNELFVWDRLRHSAYRVALAPSRFVAVWLDDQRLVYEGGIGRDARLHLIDLESRDDRTLKARFGAGLVGLPEAGCVTAAPEVATDGGVEVGAPPAEAPPVD